ncbi:NADPH-dependent FMN reductase [Pseudarthrobacter sp. SSS035]|uniref:NADPH-dependent FMN reductase n=1 Tax=Pseudarthrobacter sp. SSS035 TaxID=2931399 RepID=UPI00200C29E3|nr:NADPH-dependent FMN reductase [Pseudarthrobacter sp. SSS035]
MYIVGIGGTVSPSSSSERALRKALRAAEDLGAWTTIFTGHFLKDLPMYDPGAEDRTDQARALVTALRDAEGVVISSAAYHGGPSGLLKNALDYAEDLAEDERVYFSGLPIGLISVAMGWQAAVTNLSALRATTHSLRGWPTPYGCIINTDPAIAHGDPVASQTDGLDLVAREVVSAAGRLNPCPTYHDGPGPLKSAEP